MFLSGLNIESQYLPLNCHVYLGMPKIISVHSKNELKRELKEPRFLITIFFDIDNIGKQTKTRENNCHRHI